MFRFLSAFQAAKPVTAVVNEAVITVQPKETLLQAALRQGIDFPHSCRVGGCATCKCRLLEGRVKELTQAGYILSDDELDQGYILACQSVPRGDVKIAVDLQAVARKQVTGRVIGQEALTHDIVRLRIQLDEALLYKAGLFAHVELSSLPGVARSYSFASPVQPDAQVSFFVRLVPGGRFSAHVHTQKLVGQSVSVEGPMGDFWLRPAEAPMLMVAGGSGLAPVLAVLEDALAQDVKRPVCLLFGARTQADLYAQDDIAALARQWPSQFEFVPVLSQEPEGSTWAGLRGPVSDALVHHVVPGCHAYLCGPPPMVDAVQTQLLERGVLRSLIHADRFSTLHDMSVAA
jgi:3-phenylpropionate/trans-cinnamate dioxygenase ferredoxin reductase subunit